MNLQDLEKAVNKYCIELLKVKGYISPVEVLIELGYLSKFDYESWRFKRVPYLEKVCKVNLSKLLKIIRYIEAFSSQRNLKKSCTSYKSYGKGSKIDLQFSKNNNEKIESRYSTHYVLRNN